MALSAQFGGGQGIAIFGPNTANVNDVKNYTVFGTPNIVSTNWYASFGAIVQSSNNINATVRFTSQGTRIVSAVAMDSFNNFYTDDYTVTVTSSAPSTPPTPSVSNYCGYTRLTRANPPSGVTYYWQSSSGGTSTSNSSSYVDKTNGSVYYLRARNTAGLWSSSRSVNYSVNFNPSTPTLPSVSNNCGSTVLTRANPPSGVTWYWQSSSSGTSTSNSSASIIRITGTVYYLRGRNNATGCWSSARTVNYSIYNGPSIPSAPSVTNNCTNVVLTRGTPPSGVTWYWQDSSGGTSTLNSSVSVTLSSGSTYYLKARKNDSGCWSPSRPVSYIISPITYYFDNDGDGFGNPSNSITTCAAQPSGTVTNNSDYNDGTTLVTNIAPQTWYRDADGDGLGDNSATLTASFKRLGWATNNTDAYPDDPTNGASQPIVPSDENRIRVKSYQDANESEAIENVSYFDGLGRKKQDVAVQASGTASAKSPNLAPGWSMDWTVGTGSTAFFNQNGTTVENSRIQAPDPFGRPATIWECGNEPDHSSDGGWNTDSFNVDRTKTYRYTVWVKRNHSQNGSTYHGTQHVNNLSGSANGNPYFWSGDLPQLDTWYLMVGIIHPHTHGSTDTGVSGVYDIQGNKVLDGTEFKWRSDTTTSYFRSYLFYCTDVNVRQYFHAPVLEIIDGNELPLQKFFDDGNPKDIVTHIEYDDYGRQSKQYLPYMEYGNIGAFRNGAKTATHNHYTEFYGADINASTPNPFSETEYEASPLNRVLKQAAPGHDWRMGGGHEIEFGYDTNVTNEVRFFKVTFSGGNTESPQLSQSGYYPAKQLYKTVTYDENHTSGTNHSTEEFKNKKGQVVLKRTYNDGPHDTYYVYDEFGNLTYVIPPKVTTASVSSTELSELCYQYKYDHRNRLVEKKLPGKDWEYIIYNTLNQPVMTQDGNLRANNQWLFTKYDAFGRVTYTGLHTQPGNTSRLTMQGYADNTSTYDQYETKLGSSSTLAGTTIYYSKNAIPQGITEIHTINYYDSYVDTDGLNVPATVLGQVKATNVNGLPTVVKVRVLGTSDWITTITGYDVKGRVIYTANKNNYLNTVDAVKNQLDFAGKLIQTTMDHTKAGQSTITTIDNFTYDQISRLVKQTQTIGSHTETLVENSYDELGQLAQKKVGGGLQTVDYQYNVRGWLKQINDPSNLGGDLFAFKINYSNPGHGGTALYNGNISETEWRTANTDSNLKWYKYGYDALNRITLGQNWNNSYNLSYVTYDKNGNIETLKRHGWQNSSSYWDMDILDYDYDEGNKLLKVADGGNDNYGFVDGANTATEYTYDVNGNMTSDANKGITGIVYNHLDLPTSISISGTGGNGTISYIYDATGSKLKKTVSTGSTMEYAAGYVYENGTLQFFDHPEGYVTPDGSGGYDYVYQYTDHLGNVRLSYMDNNGTTEIVEENNYYPFGLKHRGYNTTVSPLGNGVAQRWKYNGMELDESLGLGTYDFGARNYDPALGRWMNIDPLAEYMRRHGPYNYAYNNPVAFIDPDGMLGMAAFGISQGISGNVMGSMYSESEEAKPDDFYDQNGNWLGSSDKNYIVTDETDVQTITDNTAAGKETSLSELNGHVEELPNQMVRDKMKDAVDKSNRPTTASDNPDPNFIPDPTGGFHEEGGIVGLNYEDNLEVREAYPGSKGDPNVGGTQASVDLNKGPNHDGSYFATQLLYHVHPGGTDPVTGRSFNQKPSTSFMGLSGALIKGDLPNSGNIREAVLSAGPSSRGGQKVYFYKNGKITSSFPLQQFFTIPDPK